MSGPAPGGVDQRLSANPGSTAAPSRPYSAIASAPACATGVSGEQDAGAGGLAAARAALEELAGTLRVTTLSVDEEGVALLTLNRPKALNALNRELLGEVASTVRALDASPAARVIVLTGAGDKAFAAGADIKEMAGATYASARASALLEGWAELAKASKPLVAAVNGYALGGGCELAMLCDIIIASDRASFGQPEIGLGIIPGMGGTQRLTRALGKSRAMEIILTGGRIDAAEAAARGLASRVVPHADLVAEATALARAIAVRSLPAVAIAKECVNVAYESSLEEGLKFEKRAFWSCFSLDDQKEGMAAFVEKRKPRFRDE